MDEIPEYVHMTLPDGEAVRFNRSFGGYRFDDEEVDWLMRGGDITFDTDDWRGICGGLDWREFEGVTYYGFAPWDARVYGADKAPFPVRFEGHAFTPSEEAALRAGEKVLIAARGQKGLYGVHVSYGLARVSETDDRMMWRIRPHFEEFDIPAREMTRETCLFKPVFSDRVLTHEEIQLVRSGRPLPHVGVGKNRRTYRCVLHLRRVNGERFDGSDSTWRLVPSFR